MPSAFEFRGHTRVIARALVETMVPRWPGFDLDLTDPVLTRLENTLSAQPRPVQALVVAGLWGLEVSGPGLRSWPRAPERRGARRTRPSIDGDRPLARTDVSAGHPAVSDAGESLCVLDARGRALPRRESACMARGPPATPHASRPTRRPGARPGNARGPRGTRGPHNGRLHCVRRRGPRDRGGRCLETEIPKTASSGREPANGTELNDGCTARD
jgi:hypothetical protein